jgi:hypothetical protein
MFVEKQNYNAKKIALRPMNYLNLYQHNKNTFKIQLTCSLMNKNKKDMLKSVYR